MSVFYQATIECGHCQTTNHVDYAVSVNADRRPDLRAEILDGSFQSLACSSCGAALRLPAHLTYLDIGRGQWILVESHETLANWRAAEDEAKATFDLAFGPQTPDVTQAIGAELKPRLVFGWPALREKLIVGDLGLDDETVELLKMSLIASVDAPPLADQTEFRLMSGDDATLNFAWLVSASEQQIAALAVPRGAYEDIVDDADDWAAMRASFDGQMFVDMQRLLSGSGAVPPLAGPAG